MEIIGAEKSDEWLVKTACKYEYYVVKDDCSNWLGTHYMFSFSTNLASCMAQQLHAIRLGLADEVS